MKYGVNAKEAGLKQDATDIVDGFFNDAQFSSEFVQTNPGTSFKEAVTTFDNAVSSETIVDNEFGSLYFNKITTDGASATYEAVLYTDMRNRYTPEYFMPYTYSAFLRHATGNPDITLTVKGQNFPVSATTSKIINVSLSIALVFFYS